MMLDIHKTDGAWLLNQLFGLTESLNRISPSEYNEKYRYLPPSVTPIPGPLSYDVNPYAREIVDCFDVDSPIREVNLKKGVQVTYTTILESGMFYYITHIKTVPIGYITADKELATARIENNIIPMLNQSGFGHVIQSSDLKNRRKTGKTKNQIQWGEEGYMIPLGANNEDKFRQFSFCIMLKDEMDPWPDIVGKDGDPDALSDDRCSAYWANRKIFRGGTPLIKHASKIERAFLKGDQRRYYCRCVKCGFPQVLRWSGVNKESGLVYGMYWDYTTEGNLDVDSVRYVCADCGHPHQEYDKTKLFSPKEGAEWRPTAVPADPFIRSYHLPGMYSPLGMAPWSKLVGLYLDAYDPIEKRVRNLAKLQVFYNNVLAEPFDVRGTRVTYDVVSMHKRNDYTYGRVPNDHARKFAGGPILFLTCAVDVQKAFLSVAIVGWTKGMRNYLIDYFQYRDEDCSRPESPAWDELQNLIDDKEYTSSDGITYRVAVTFIDASWETDTIYGFCFKYAGGVYPIVGRERPARNQAIKEHAEYHNSLGSACFRILVDHYKDRLGSTLRREWSEEAGIQDVYQFNAPINITKAQLEELTRETKEKKTDELGRESWIWKRRGRNELWDLLVYSHAAVEVFAWSYCIQYLELKEVDWERFWLHFDIE